MFIDTPNPFCSFRIPLCFQGLTAAGWVTDRNLLGPEEWRMEWLSIEKKMLWFWFWKKFYAKDLIYSILEKEILISSGLSFTKSTVDLDLPCLILPLLNCKIKMRCWQHKTSLLSNYYFFKNVMKCLHILPLGINLIYIFRAALQDLTDVYLIVQVILI